ncbi:TPA: hypothetical protein ACKPFR_001322 [Pseudomonas aeruginosa]
MTIAVVLAGSFCIRGGDDSPKIAGNYGRKPRQGLGYLAGTYPGGLTTVDGVPVPATVRVLYRPESGATGDGVVVAEVASAADGTWRVDGLDPAARYDVVGRKVGFNDIIMADVSPALE